MVDFRTQKKNKTNSRRHMAVDNLHSGKALVSDYALDKKTGKNYQPSYMKKTNKAGPAKIKNSTIYQDSKPNVSNAPRPNFKEAVNKDTKKKKRMELGRNIHNAAKKLMGGY